VSHLGVGNGTVARVWREHGMQPWRVETFKFSTDPELVAKVTDIVGLYLDPPDNAIVLCVDEESQIQALDRAAPTLPMQIGSPSVRRMTTCVTARPRCSSPWTSRPARSPDCASHVIVTRNSWPCSSRCDDSDR
jgi:hypothetical protein